MTVLPPDPYKILGVSKDAQIPEIRSAHRKLILKCHPDKVQDPTLKAEKQIEFQQVQQAYELLSDDKDRQRYDDQSRLAELKKKMAAAKANTSSPRSATYTKVEIRTAEPRPGSFKSAAGSPPKTYYSRSYEEDIRRPHIFEVKREPSFDKPPKRDSERDRERERELRERDLREREKEKERERKRKEKEEAARRIIEKEAKDARRQEKRRQEKEFSKEKKRETEEKKRHAKPYIESPFDSDEVHVPGLKSDKKKSSKKHEEKRERSSHREEPPITVPPPMPDGDSYTKLEQARSYINSTRTKPSGIHRAKHMQQPPAAPTPPPVSSPFAVPDDDVRRSSAKPIRRGSSGEKSFRKSSKEVLDDDNYVSTSPSARHAAAAATGSLSGSPPRREPPLRQNTMPAVADPYARPMPPMTRAYTDMPASMEPRGRDRSRMQSQTFPTSPMYAGESDEEFDYAQERADYRSRKHRSSKKTRSPSRSAHVKQYRVDGGRTTLQSTTQYVRSFESQPDFADYYTQGGVHVVERPSMYPREHSYSRSGYPSYPKVKTSKAYGTGDVAYSDYPTATYEEAY